MELVPAKHIVTRNKSTAWFGCEYNMNIYRGCSHGCIYCDSRSACYHIEGFDQVRAKADALRIVRDDLARRIHTGVVATGAMSDPYNPLEAAQMLTRHSLELVSAYGYGIAMATKSDMIVRDIDILQDIGVSSPVLCKITITTLDDELAKKIEPAAPSSTRRFNAVRALADAGIFTGVLLMPVLPFIEDSDENVLGIVRRAAESGARFVYPSFGVTQRTGQVEYMLNGLEQAFPGEGLAAKYQSRFGGRYHATSPRAKHLWGVFTAECQKTGMLYNMRDIVRAYRQGKETGQLSFL